MQDSWAICRIFKKTNPVAHQRINFSHYHSQSSLSPVSTGTTTLAESPNTSTASLTPQAVVPSHQNNVPFSIMPTNTEQIEPSPWIDTCPSLDIAASSYKTLSSMLMPGLINDGLEDFLLSSHQTSDKMNKPSAVDFSSILSNLACSDHVGIGSVCEGIDSYGGYQDQQWFDVDDGSLRIQNDQPISSSLMRAPQDDREQWDWLVGLSYNLTNLSGTGAWRSNLAGWDTSELSTLFSTTTTTKCHI